MRRILILGAVFATALTVAAAALASTQTAHSGDVSATYGFKGSYPNYSGERLTITKAGTVVYDQPVVSRFCGTQCAPGAPQPKLSSVRVLDLEHNGQPDVVLDLFSGGAHCCGIEQVFSFDPGSNTYVKTERNFGDYGAQVVDLRHDGRIEFLSADDAFAYAFTSFAASGLPIQILAFSNRHFRDVTRQYPKLIAKDATRWLRLFKGMAKQHYQDSVGVIAAWAADEELLGHRKLVSGYLARQAKAGHLNSADGPPAPSGKKFVAQLMRFLGRHGYLR
jgi:hypothetical protein